MARQMPSNGPAKITLMPKGAPAPVGLGNLYPIECYGAWCSLCERSVSAAPRLTREDAANDLRVHLNIVHEGEVHA